MKTLTETEAGHTFGGQPGLHTELLSEQDRVRIVKALRLLYLESREVGTAELDLDVLDLLFKLANPKIAVWVQRPPAP